MEIKEKGSYLEMKWGWGTWEVLEEEKISGKRCCYILLKN